MNHSRWRTSSHSNAEGNCVEADGPWRTSSYSEAGANINCVEAAGPWHASSYSAQTGECVEASGPWHTSGHCGSNANCVEVSEGAVVRVRDTKDRERGQLAVSGAAWTAFLGGVTA